MPKSSTFLGGVKMAEESETVMERISVNRKQLKEKKSSMCQTDEWRVKG